MNTQAVVVYTPLEHLIYSSPLTFPIFVGAAVFIILAVILTSLVDKIFTSLALKRSALFSRKRREWSQYFALAVALVAGLLTIHTMVI